MKYRHENMHIHTKYEHNKGMYMVIAKIFLISSNESVKFHRFSSSSEKEIQREALVSSKILKHPFMIVQINDAFHSS